MERRPRIRIVGDESGSRARLEAILVPDGYELAFADSGLEALARWMRSRQTPSCWTP